MCGEKSKVDDRQPGGQGSPPHVRGKAVLHIGDLGYCGITPAYAGKRSPRRRTNSFSRDHPRICGEKLYFFSKLETMRGSPPHMRGKGDVAHMTMKEIGITPAYAGKRLKRSRSTVPHAAIVPLFPSVCNKPAGSDGSPAGHDAPPFLPIENAAPASPVYNLRSL